MGRLDHDPKPRKSRLDSGDPAWRKHEKRSAKRTKGRDAPRPLRGDGTSYTLFQREAKHTTGKSIGVKKSWLEKIDREATVARKWPLVVLGFDDMAPGVDDQWACVPLSVLNELIAVYEERLDNEEKK
jgi:hypothetical protein